MKYEMHPACAAWPPMPACDIEKLAADIKANGLRQPVILHEDKILDGRNRALACEMAGVDLKTEVYAGTDPVGFVVSMNLHRRHLKESQRSMIGARLADMRQGARTDLSSIEPTSISQAQAAEMLNVGVASVKRAKTVLKSGDGELITAVDPGKKSVSAAAREAEAGAGTKRKATPHREPEKAPEISDIDWLNSPVGAIAKAVGRVMSHERLRELHAAIGKEIEAKDKPKGKSKSAKKTEIPAPAETAA
jgi:ParB-like chromosome segregation protein Spo0J